VLRWGEEHGDVLREQTKHMGCFKDGELAVLTEVND
jgi:hypothetical protein